MTTHEKEQIRQMRLAGYGYQQVAKVLGCPEASIKSFGRRNELLGRVLAKRSPENTCQQCGHQIPLGTVRRERRFCSDRCRYKWWNANRHMRHTSSKKENTCPVCHSAFYTYDKDQRYCCRRCYVTARFGKDISDHDEGTV